MLSTFVSNIQRQFSSTISATGSSPFAPPALLTSTEAPPKDSVQEANSSTEPESVTSRNLGSAPISAASFSIQSTAQGHFEAGVQGPGGGGSYPGRGPGHDGEARSVLGHVSFVFAACAKTNLSVHQDVRADLWIKLYPSHFRASYKPTPELCHLVRIL